MYWNLSGFLAVVALSGVVLSSPPEPASGAGPAAGITSPADSAPGSSLHRETGTIEGVLRMPPRPRRRTVNRYGGAPAAAEVQPIAAVVFLKGRIGPSPEPAAGAVMAQGDTAFVPSLLVVPVGTTVRFPNQDPFFHNVFSYSVGGRFDLGRYPMGESKDVTFGDPGIVKVYCEVHESMRAAIVVVENSHWAEPDDDGAFRLQGVPPGTYTLVAWQADRGEVEREVTVPSDGVVRVELEL